MFVTVRHLVTDIEAVINGGFDRVGVFRSDAREGDYVELTDVATRLVIDPAKLSYKYVDYSVAPNDPHWYRFSYFNSVTGQQSYLTRPVEAGKENAGYVITVEEFKQEFLFGMDISDAEGNEMPDEVFERAIAAGVDFVEKEVAITIIPKAIKEHHDYYTDDVREWLTFHLERPPIIAVESVNLDFGFERGIYPVPKESYRFYKIPGQLQCVFRWVQQIKWEISRQLVAPANGATFDGMPQAWTIDYTAGMVEVPPLVRQACAYAAAMPLLPQAGNLIFDTPGLATSSISVDAISQSMGSTASALYGGFSSTSEEYKKLLKDAIATLKRHYGKTTRVLAA